MSLGPEPETLGNMGVLSSLRDNCKWYVLG